uniref:Immunoglobulin G binding protein B n=1 Tax=Rhipicephalus haemaphysaloides haemaphysaloides TaxID=237075 RepID=Q2VIW7_RHIHE|nr:immunoglobulin G binding protein B [Rhipicephalus haemaphysaloides haemaphysaloides]
MTFAIVAVLLGSLGGGGESPVQYHPMLRCDTDHTAEIMRVTTKDAVVNSTMKAKIKLRVYDAILKDLKLRLALFTPEGHIVPCIDGFGSCVYDLCKANKNTTLLLGNGTEPNNNAQCPVPPGTYYRTLEFKLSSKLTKHIGNGELLGTMQLESGSKVVACHAYFMVLYSTKPKAKEWY